MDSERIKEIQAETAYPQSRSVHQALLKVWNECEQDKKMYSEEDMVNYALFILNNNVISVKEWFEKFKNK